MELEERLLDEIAGVFGLSQLMSHDAQEHRRMPIEERPERALVAFHVGGHEIFVGPRLHGFGEIRGENATLGRQRAPAPRAARIRRSFAAWTAWHTPLESHGHDRHHHLAQVAHRPLIFPKFSSWQHRHGVCLSV